MPWPFGHRARVRRFKRRQQAVVNQWTTGRFLESAGLDLTECERAPIVNIHKWRLLLGRFLPEAAELSDVYCFGSAHGHSIADLVMMFRSRGTALPRIHAFDSFAGLPAEVDGVAIPPLWHPGAFANSVEDFTRIVRELHVPDETIVVHRGWFADTLRPDAVAAGLLRTARYIDFDADLYRSTRDALDFMFAHRLIQPGTVIGYDDWGDTELWRAGESRAHREMFDRYRVAATQLFSWGEPPLVRTAFRVESIAW